VTCRAGCVARIALSAIIDVILASAFAMRYSGPSKSREGAMTGRVLRSAARIIAIDETERVLLLQYARSTGERFWATPGGGLEGDESFEAAAIREVAEELGVTGVTLEPLWNASTVFEAAGRTIDQEERFFLLRLDASVIPTDVRAAHQADGILQARWWTISELRDTNDLLFPEDLAARVAAVISAERAR
jgi:8-oxo-dGTP pyrophosphatase MutT (NUDIX family)